VGSASSCSCIWSSIRVRFTICCIASIGVNSPRGALKGSKTAKRCCSRTSLARITSPLITATALSSSIGFSPVALASPVICASPLFCAARFTTPSVGFSSGRKVRPPFSGASLFFSGVEGFCSRCAGPLLSAPVVVVTGPCCAEEPGI
jgi:hypothetical protein